MINLDSVFGVHEQAIYLRAKRAEVLANNMVNADTPNFKARDFNFQETLKSAQTAGSSDSMNRTRRNHIDISSLDAMINLKYRTPISPSADGNTVDSQVESTLFAENALQYQASTTFLNGKIKGLLTAIRGD